MSFMSQESFSIGEFAQKSGVSIRTLRYYDSIGLLTPDRYTDGGHRLYGVPDLHRLQQIQALKFLRFSLKEIKEIMDNSVIEESSLTDSLQRQQEVFKAKQKEINRILASLSHLNAMIAGQNQVDVSIFCFMLHTLILEKETKDWYRQSFSKEEADELFDLHHKDKLKLDQEWMQVLSTMKSLVNQAVPPFAPEAQVMVRQLMTLMERTVKGNLDKFNKQLDMVAEFDFPDPFTEKEQRYLKEAIDVYYQKDRNI